MAEIEVTVENKEKKSSEKANEKRFLDYLEKKWVRFQNNHPLFCTICEIGLFWYLLKLFFYGLDCIYGSITSCGRSGDKTTGLTAQRKYELYNQFKAQKFKQYNYKG